MSAAERTYVTRANTDFIEGYRLTPERQDELAQVARGDEESLAGVRTRYFVDLAGGAGLKDLDDVHLFDAERVIERHAKELHRIRRCRTALRTMQQSAELRMHVGPLCTVYGWPDPWAQRYLPAAWGELRYLARFTEAVEHQRQRFIRHRLPKTTNLDEVRRARHDLDRQLSSREALRLALKLPADQRRDVARAILAQCDQIIELASLAYHDVWAGTA